MADMEKVLMNKTNSDIPIGGFNLLKRLHIVVKPLYEAFFDTLKPPFYGCFFSKERILFEKSCPPFSPRHLQKRA